MQIYVVRTLVLTYHLCMASHLDLGTIHRHHHCHEEKKRHVFESFSSHESKQVRKFRKLKFYATGFWHQTEAFFNAIGWLFLQTTNCKTKWIVHLLPSSSLLLVVACMPCALLGAIHFIKKRKRKERKKENLAKTNLKKLCSILPADDSNFIWILLIIQQWFQLEYVIFIFFTDIALIKDKRKW